jgi:hypothetical protein
VTGLSGADIAGMVVGMLFGLGLLGLLVFWLFFIKNRRQRAETQKKVAQIMADREHQVPAPESAFVPPAMNTPKPMDEIRGASALVRLPVID